MSKFKIYIYRPDTAKINLNLLYTIKGEPYFESRDRDKELRDKIEDLQEIIRYQKLRGKKKYGDL